MIYYISIFVVVIFLIAFILIRETGNPSWVKLDSLYRGREPIERLETKPIIQMLFFKEESDVDFDYLNSAKIYLEKDVLIIKPTINHFLLKTIIIPWEGLEQTGDKILFLKRRKVYKVKDSDLYLGI